MTGNSHRGLFFVATALMCAVSLYGSELARAAPDELTAASSSGAPRQLTLPPGFKIEVASEQNCADRSEFRALCGSEFLHAGGKMRLRCNEHRTKTELRGRICARRGQGRNQRRLCSPLKIRRNFSSSC
jgi:hypothetical protein